MAVVNRRHDALMAAGEGTPYFDMVTRQRTRDALDADRLAG